MTDKELFLQDIGARLLYHPIFKINCSTVKATLYGIEKAFDGTYRLSLRYKDKEGNTKYLSKFISQCKIYLRPMSSMTKEEKVYLSQRHFYEGESAYANVYIAAEVIDWMTEHHLDFRGLIEKGLALEAPEGMYNN